MTTWKTKRADKKATTKKAGPARPLRARPASDPMDESFLEAIRQRNDDFAKKIRAGGPGVKAGDVVALHADMTALLQEVDRLRDRRPSQRMIEDILKKTTALAAASGIEESDAVSLVARSWPN